MAAPDRTHYDVLGISRDADASAVRSAWKLHVQAWHPDRFGNEQKAEAERQTSRINEAYSVLRDSSRRAAYDCSLAAEELASRPEPVRRSSPRPAMHAAAPRAAATPVGTPMARVAEPQTLGEQVSAIGADAWRIVRRHPRLFALAACTWLVIFGGSIVLHAMNGPTLPSAPAAQPVSAITADDAQVEDLAELAELAREEAAEADAELKELLAEDARLAALEAAAAERDAKAAAAAQRRQQRRRGTTATPKRSPDGRRIVRVMPKAQ